jgi:CBS domain containing-hemolysin-like protein
MFEIRIVIWFVLTILLMGFFAGIEMAFYSANRMSIELKKKQGRASGQILDQFMITGLFSRHYAHRLQRFSCILRLQISKVMEPLWVQLDVGSDFVRILIEILLSTFLVLVFAEFLPRAIFRARANVLLSRMAQLIDIFYQMFYPIAAACIAWPIGCLNMFSM